MSWRQRAGGDTDVRPRLTNRPVYEDFDPKIDTNEGEEARVVALHVPGFAKEQMRITAEHGNNLRVQGQRLSNNKWIRFVQLLPVPQNCEVNKIHAKFNNGVLTITMPKEVPKTLMSTRAEKPAEKTNRENVTDTLPKATGSKVVPPTVSEPNQKAAAAAELRAQKGHEKTHQTPTGAEKMTQKAGSEEKMVKKVDPAAERDAKKMGGSPIAQKEIAEPKGQKGHEKTNQTPTGAEKMPQKVGSEEKMVKKVDPAAEREPKKMGGSPISQKEIAEPKGQKDQEKADQTHTGVEKMPRKTGSEEKVVKKVDSTAERDAKKMGSSPIAQRGHEEGLAKASTEPKAQKVQELVSSIQGKKDKKEGKEMVKELETGTKVVGKSSEKTNESTMKGKEQESTPPAEVAAVSKALEDGKKVIEKLVSGAANEEKHKKDNGESSNVNKLGIKYIAETAKQTVSNAVKNLNEDDRQLLINIGAAVMVLVALGAYISFGNFASSTEREN